MTEENTPYVKGRVAPTEGNDIPMEVVGDNVPAQAANSEKRDEQAEEILPSFFKTLTTSCHQPLKSRQELEYLITKDPYTFQITMGYRQKKPIDRNLAGICKKKSKGITPSVRFRRNGKEIQDIGWETGWLMLDYDEMTAEEAQEALHKASLLPHTMVSYRTISGCGLRVLCRYMRPKGCLLTMVDLHHLALSKAIRIYDEALGHKADLQCLDITRICGLAHDEEAYFFWDAQPIPLTLHETDEYLLQIEQQEAAEEARLKDVNKRRRGRPKGSKNSKGKSSEQAGESLGDTISADGYGSDNISLDLILRKVDENAMSWNVTFQPHHHNEFVNRFVFFCHKYGARQDELTQEVLRRYGTYEGCMSIIKNVYKKKDTFGSWTLDTESLKDYKHRASNKVVMQWLNTHYQFQHNTVTDKIQFRALDIKDDKFYNWTDMSDTHQHTLYLRMDLQGIHCSSSKQLEVIIDSEFSPDFNPMESYLQDLPLWHEGDPDYIGDLARTVHVKNMPELYHTQEEFVEVFRKWLVCMVVSWSVKKSANQALLIFVGVGGIFKTTFFEKLLPPELYEYFANDSSGDYKSKDFLELISSKGLLLLDEFGVPHGKDLNALKSSITKLIVTYRIPYHMYSTALKRYATFCATSNYVHIIPEEESRRYMAWEIESIDSPFDHPFNYQGIYSQAVALAKKALANHAKMKEKAKSGSQDADNLTKEADSANDDEIWNYWLSNQEMEHQKLRNKHFMVNDYISERILKFYKVPDPGTKLEFQKFVTASDVLDRICCAPMLRMDFSSKDINKKMNDLGFPSKHRRTGNGWYVIEYRGDEIERNSQANNDLPDNDNDDDPNDFQ